MNFSKAKRAVATLMLATMVLGQASTVSAAGKNFSMDKKWTTIPRDEAYQPVCSKPKADNEQRWYITLTKVDGLANPTSNRNGNAIAATKAPTGFTKPIPLFKNDKNKRKSQEYFSGSGARKNVKCVLHIGGNSNNTKRYTIQLAGRYSS